MWILKKSDGVVLYALKAVVELHKPYEYFENDGSLDRNCDLCDDIYPCPTIQAIEKELQ